MHANLKSNNNNHHNVFYHSVWKHNLYAASEFQTRFQQVVSSFSTPLPASVFFCCLPGCPFRATLKTKEKTRVQNAIKDTEYTILFLAFLDIEVAVITRAVCPVLSFFSFCNKNSTT